MQEFLEYLFFQLPLYGFTRHFPRDFRFSRALLFEGEERSLEGETERKERGVLRAPSRSL